MRELSYTQSCGLMQKKDIRQLVQVTPCLCVSCGLMQKKDIRQPTVNEKTLYKGCGLMQKNDIRQQRQGNPRMLEVVV